MKEILMIALILLPLFGGACFYVVSALKEKRARSLWLMAVLALELVLAVIVVVLDVQAGAEMNRNEDYRWGGMVLWQFAKGLSFRLAVDNLSYVFLLLFSGMWLLAGLYSLEYMEHEERKERFYAFYLMTLASLMGIAMSKNMLTLYLFYEFMTLLSLPMVLHSQTPEAKKAGMKYLFYSIGGAFLALGGMMLIYYGAGIELDFSVGGKFFSGQEEFARYTMTYLYDRQALLAPIGALLMLIGFGSKAGMFPLQAWLPTAHPVAPAPASAVLSGVITKSGVLAIIRVMYYVIGFNALAGTWFQYTWLGLSMITVFMGSMLAYKEKQLKKRLAFSTVSQVSYVMFGLATMHPLGILGALMHILFHSVIKNTLFFSAGSIIHHTGKTKVSELRGIGKEMPVTMWCFTLVSIALVGIPPTSAFVSKWYLAQGALSWAEAGLPGIFAYGGPVVLLVSALLTAGYLVTISMKAFLPGTDFDYANLKRREAGWRMLVPMLILTVLAVVLGMYMEPLTQFLKVLAYEFVYAGNASSIMIP